MNTTKNDCLCYFSLRTTSKANKQSATKDFEYINRLDSSSKRRDLIYANSLNLPAWANNNPAYFWKMVTELESPQGREAVHIRAALPNALSMNENIKLMKEYINKTTTHAEGLLPCSFALHFKESKKPNPHFHLIIYERPLKLTNIPQDLNTYFKKANRHYPERGGVKKVNYFTQVHAVKKLRILWADTANIFLEKTQRLLRMNPLSYHERGIAKIPQIPLGSKDSYFNKKGISTPRTKINEEIQSMNKDLDSIDMLTSSLERLQEIWKICEEEEYRNWLEISFAEKELLFYISSLLNRTFQESSLEELILFYNNEYQELDLIDKFERIIKNLILDGYKFDEISSALVHICGNSISKSDLSALYNEIYYSSIQEIDWINDIQFVLEDMTCGEEVCKIYDNKRDDEYIFRP